MSRTAYETGARKLAAHVGPDPSDAFSQDAAGNRKPDGGVGLTEESDMERSETDKSDLRNGTPQSDAAGQSEEKHAGGENDGMSSADPRVLSGKTSGDATFHTKTGD